MRWKHDPRVRDRAGAGEAAVWRMPTNAFIIVNDFATSSPGETLTVVWDEDHAVKIKQIALVE